MEAAKKARALAKGLFTKSQKALIRIIEKNSPLEIVESRMSNVIRTYHEVQMKHEEYVSTLTDESAIEAEEAWMNLIDDEYDTIEERKVKYVRALDGSAVGAGTSKEMKAEAEPEGSESLRSHESQYLSMREVELVAFNTIHSNVTKKIDIQMKSEEPMLDIVKEELADLKRQYQSCKQTHHKYISTLSKIPESEIKWAGTLQERVMEVSDKLSLLMEKKEESKRGGVQLEKLKMPTFAGAIREYPRFKADFQRQILPKYKKDVYGAAYALKACLSGEPLNIVRNVDDNHEEMWKRLDEKYGNKSRVIDAIMNEIKNLNHVSSANSDGFIKLVSKIENGYRDLERLKLESEIANSTAISIIEDKLPDDIRRLWALDVSKPSNSQSDLSSNSDASESRFIKLLDFLLYHKRAIEYDVDNIRVRRGKDNNNNNSVVNLLNNHSGPSSSPNYFDPAYDKQPTNI